MATTELLLKPGKNYRIVLEPRTDQEELSKNGVAVYIPEEGWIGIPETPPLAEPEE